MPESEGLAVGRKGEVEEENGGRELRWEESGGELAGGSGAWVGPLE